MSGTPDFESVSLFAPRYSPTGQKLAWVMSGTINGTESKGLGLFDLQKREMAF
jgi:hypothetical protein